MSYCPDTESARVLRNYPGVEHLGVLMFAVAIGPVLAMLLTVALRQHGIEVSRSMHMGMGAIVVSAVWLLVQGFVLGIFGP